MVKVQKFSSTWWRHRLSESTAAILLTVLVIQISGMVSQREKELLPPTAWFEVYEVYVPDHEVGTNPKVLYDRVIRERFTGAWVVEVQTVRPGAVFVNTCSGSGVNLYEPDERLDGNLVTWEWFIGRPCKVPPGTYRLRVSYVMQQPGWPVKEALVNSNIFEVKAPSDGAALPEN